MTSRFIRSAGRPRTIILVTATALCAGLGLYAALSGIGTGRADRPVAQPNAQGQTTTHAQGNESDLTALESAYTPSQTCTPDAALLKARMASKTQYGINLSGLEHTTEVLPGNLGTTYFAPDRRDIAYFASHGFTAIRLPIAWERMQPSLMGPLNSSYSKLI